MSFLSNLIKQAAPVVATVAPFIPGGQAVAAVATAKAAADQRAAQVYQQNLQRERISRNMVMGSGEFGTPGLRFQPTVPTAREMGFFDRLGGIASNVGNTLLTGLENAVPSVISRAVFGGNRPQSVIQSPAVTTTSNVGAQETSGSGSVQPNQASFLAPVLNTARNLLKTPGGQLALGGGTAGLISVFGEQPAGTRMTRKMKSQARMVLNMVGGDISAAAGILRISEEMLVALLLKRFRNDGPVVTKAALRKTKQTIRRLHSMQDVLKSITPTAAGRRRAPMKRATTTTLIKN
jgi:hypothetical protein